MMKKRLVAIFLLMALLAALMTGCGSDTSSADGASSEEETTQAEVEETGETEAEEEAKTETETAEEMEEAETEEPEPAESADEDAATDADTESEAADTAESISYPVEGNVTLTVWRAFETMMWGDLMESYYDLPMLETIEESTGITLEFTSVSDSSSTEQFNLMIASGDWNDLINLNSYTGGLAKAYEDELCYDLSPLMETYMPDYYAVLQNLKETNPDAYKQTVTDDGRSLAIYTIDDVYVQQQGLLYRADWAEEIGLSDLVTMDDLTAYLEYVMAEYSPIYGLTPSSGGGIDDITGAFGTAGFDASGESVDLGLYLEGSTVASSLTSDNYRAYIEWFYEMYQLGAIKDDFYSETYGPDWANSYVSEGNIAITSLRSDKISAIINDATDPDFDLQPTSAIVMNEGDSYHFSSEQTVIETNFSVMSTTEHLEEALMFLNWFYTEEGSVVSNYGIEGYTFNYDEDGVVRFTEVITDSGYSNAVMVRNLYGAVIFPFLRDVDVFFYSYADVEQASIEIWSVIDDNQVLPSFELSSEDSTTYAYIASDISTYAATQVMKWLTGTEELTDTAWDAYVEHCESLGLSEAVALYQAGYESFESRE